MTAPDIETQQSGPYQSFKFRIKWDGQYIVGVSRMSALRRMTEVLEVRDATHPGTPRRVPGPTRYEPITLEKGVSDDTVFEAWADQVAAAGGSGAPDPGCMKDIRIEIYDETGDLALAYNVHRCWPSEYQALPALDGAATGAVLQVLKLEHAGWERDHSITSEWVTTSRE